MWGSLASGVVGWTCWRAQHGAICEKRLHTRGRPPLQPLWKISRLSALPTEYSKMHGRGSWRKRWTSHYDFGHNLLKARDGQLCSLLSVSLSFFGLHRDLVVSHGLL